MTTTDPSVRQQLSIRSAGADAWSLIGIGIAVAATIWVLLRLYVLAPMRAVDRISTDRIELNLDRQQFKTLESATQSGQSQSASWLDRGRDLTGDVKRILKRGSRRGVR